LYSSSAAMKRLNVFQILFYQFKVTYFIRNCNWIGSAQHLQVGDTAVPASAAANKTARDCPNPHPAAQAPCELEKLQHISALWPDL